MQILKATESLNIGNKKTVLLKQISETIKLETGHQIDVYLIAKGAKIHPSLIVGSEKIFSVLIKSLSEIEEPDFYTRFEEALKNVNAAFNDFEDDLKSQILEEMSLSIGIFLDNKLFLTQYGVDIEVYLIRAKHVSVVSTDLHEDKDKEIFTNIASGVLEDNDVVLWSTERLLRYITKTDLGKQFSQNLELVDSLQNIETTISSELPIQVSLLGHKINIKEDSNLFENKEIINNPRESKNKAKNDNLKNLLNTLIEKSKQMHKSLKENKIESLKLEKLLKNFNLERYKLPVVLACIIFALIIILFVSQIYSKSRKQEQEMEAILTQIEVDIGTAASKGTYDKETAANILAKAETKALEIFNTTNSNYLRTKASQELSSIQEQKDSLDRVKRIKNPELIVDLTAANNTINSLGIVKGPDDNIYVYEYNALYVLTGDKIVDTLKIDDEQQVISAVYNEDSEEILFLTSASKIISYKNKNFQFVDTVDGAWKEATKIAVYSSKIYLLSPTNNQIYRYPQVRDSYSKAEPYSLNPNLKDSVDLSIDGAIYVINKDGTIQILSRGESLNFSIQKSPIQKIAQADKIYTEFEFPYVFVLDSTNNKIIMYSKDSKTGNLVYQGQFIFENIDKIKDFTVDKNTKTLYVLTAQKVYRMAIE